MASATPEQRAYARGYHAGSRRAWPLHKPPTPPHEQVAAVVDAARALRDAADTILAQLDPDDDFEGILGPKIDALDAAMTAVGAWLLGTDGMDGDGI